MEVSQKQQGSAARLSVRFRGYVTEAQKALQAERDLLGTEDVAAIQTVAAQHQGTQR